MANFNLDNYVPVHERIEKFYQAHETGRILTAIERLDESGLVIFKAAVYRSLDDAEPSATGHAYEQNGSSYINKTSYIENCETSAIGRALANLGIEVSRGIASREEMQKVERMTNESAPAKAMAATANGSAKKFDNKRPESGTVGPPATSAQIALLTNKAKQAGVDPMTTIRGEWSDVGSLDDLSKAAASYIIDQF